MLLFAVVAFSGVGRAGFVWDDIPLVVQNTLTGDLANIPLFFGMDLWDGSPVAEGVSGYYRPLMLMSLALDRAVYGLDVAGHHFHSLAWHLLTVGILFSFLRKGFGEAGAVVGALVFAIHPLQSEAVIWVSARNDLMATALGLGALVLLVGREAAPVRLVSAFVLATLAGLAKESAVLLPLMLLAADLVEGKGRFPYSVKRYLPLVGALVVVGGLRIMAGVGAATTPTLVGWTMLGERIPYLVGELGANLVWPWPLTAGRALEWMDSAGTWRILAGWGVIVGGCLVVWNGWRKGRVMALVGLIWAIIPLFAVLVPIADKGTVGDRYLYLPMVGISLVVASLWPRRWMGLALFLAVPAVIAIQVRTDDWRNDLTLWSASVEAEASPYSHTGLGHALREADRPDLALPHFVAAIQDERPNREACPRIVGTALAVARPQLAAQLGHWALGRGCGVHGAFGGQFAVALAFSGAWVRAAEVVAGAPEDPEGRLSLVAGALAWREGDSATLARLREGWKGTRDFDTEVGRLVGEGFEAGATIDLSPDQ